ncbi:MAG: hypothetical protein ABIL09_25105, partial [Gemmatimonadota bacterium]
MSRPIRAAILAATCLLALGPLSPAEAVRIGLYGSSYMEPVAATLDRLGLTYERVEAGQLLTRDPASLDVLFLAHDALDAPEIEGGAPAAIGPALAWLTTFRAGGGLL